MYESQVITIILFLSTKVFKKDTVTYPKAKLVRYWTKNIVAEITKNLGGSEKVTK